METITSMVEAMEKAESPPLPAPTSAEALGTQKPAKAGAGKAKQAEKHYIGSPRDVGSAKVPAAADLGDWEWEEVPGSPACE
jgi:hypothetical protein